MTGTPEKLTLLVYSDDANVRNKVRLGLGRRVAADLPVLEYVECATPAGTVMRVDEGGLDLIILDGEAVPAGGMGICRQLKDEVYNCPPVLVITGRPQDAWLANWSRADGVVTHPVDPTALAAAVEELLRARLAGTLPSAAGAAGTAG